MSSAHSDTSAKVVLTIAGSDCSGGAGIQADLKTAGVFGVYAASVITAVTAQNSYSLSQVFVLPVAQVVAQLNAVREGLPIAAIKLGMLGNDTVALAVCDFLLQIKGLYPGLPVVIDPVINASSGGNLSNTACLDIYRQQLFPLATLVTPNTLEAGRLLEQSPASTQAELEIQGQKLLAMGALAVLLKGGHFNGQTAQEQALSTDLLLDDQGTYAFSATRLEANHTHGGGCSLATAIAAGLAQGLSLRQAIAAAKTFIQGAIAHSHRLQLAEHNGPLHHFYNYW